MTRNQGIAAALAFVVLTVLLVALLYRPIEPIEPIEPGEAAPAPKPLAGDVAPAPEPAPPKPEPAPVAAPEPEPADPPEPMPLTVETKKAYNYAMDDAVREAEQVCLYPWAEQEGPGKPVTVVMDAVITDGELTDVRVRAIGDIPGDVIDCARDAAWKVDWPAFEHAGELSFQRSFSVGPEH